MKGKGNSINYKYRMHDPRIGRFFAVDPLCASYSWNSPYAFSENIVINAIEMEGMEKVYVYNVFWKNGVKHKKLSHTYIDKSLSVNQRKYRYFDGSGKVRNSVQQNITRSKSETTAAQTYLMNMAEFYEGFGDAIIDNVVSDAQTTLEYIRDPSQLGADLAQMGRLTAGNANKLIGLSDVNSGIDSKFGTEISQEVEAFWQSSVQKAAARMIKEQLFSRVPFWARDPRLLRIQTDGRFTQTITVQVGIRRIDPNRPKRFVNWLLGLGITPKS